ncbi:acyl-CoA thioesterase [Peribacillus glennii]|uniref:Acyl-CoA thioesterase n=1 Tax=Peribacillus glennii TaxID=2303991 RepID=A0A372LIX4_9BACI|nr:thioesterase family protein [Peribacillus glennii]RFU65924.1 acyl-CoA thioesterase [Peribacillus glennii]
MGRITYVNNMEDWETSFPFKHEVNVRFSETDMFGHLNNTVPFTYFEEARIEYFKTLGFMQQWVNPESEAIPVVADLQCDFLKQIFFNDKLFIHVKAERIGNSSVDIHYMGKKGNGDICLTGRGTVVQISKATGKPIPWTESARKLMEHHEESTL